MNILNKKKKKKILQKREKNFKYYQKIIEASYWKYDHIIVKMKILFHFIWIYNKYIFIFYDDESLEKKECSNQMLDRVQRLDRVLE